jgi:anti-sigma factor RsiW
MKCEEFEAIGLERDGLRMDELDAHALHAAAEHAARCSNCAALQESWAETRQSLQSLRAATAEAETPSRVEMRLRYEFGTHHRAGKIRSGAIFAAWTLATAALLFAGVSWWNWNLAKNHSVNTSAANTNNGSASTPATSTDASDENTLVADNGSADFTLLPGSLPQEIDDSAVVRVGMQRGALTALGLPVNEERVGDWIQVDLLVGEDGLPKAVRLPQ